MKVQELKSKLELGTEVRFIDRDGFKVSGTVNSLSERTFTIIHIDSKINQNGNFEMYMDEKSFTYTGKKSHHRYNYGNVVEVIGKVS